MRDQVIMIKPIETLNELISQIGEPIISGKIKPGQFKVDYIERVLVTTEELNKILNEYGYFVKYIGEDDDMFYVFDLMDNKGLN